MKIIFRKDLRENLKVAVIGLLIFSLMLIQSFQSSISMLSRIIDGNWSGQDDALQPLLSNSLLTEAAFFCAIFGAALGWLQTRNEAHRDLWAFLVHRPVTRTEIFRGKAAAGLCLYFLGAGLPLAILIAVVLTPGHVAAPFEWAMTLMPLAILLSGVAFYFAGMLTGLRQARWYASRSFGLGLALAAAAAAVEIGDGPTMIVILLAIVTLAGAVWGAYQTGGFFRGQPTMGKIALIISMLAGCGAAMFVVVGVLSALVFNPLYSNGDTSTIYQMTRDGTIYKAVYHNGSLVEIADLDGHPLMDPKTGQRMEQKEFQKLVTYGGTVVSAHKDRKRNSNINQDNRQFFKLWNVTDKTLWYVDRHGKLGGYDARTRKFIGSLDARGPDDALPAEPFLLRPDGYNYYSAYNDEPRKLLLTAKAIYRVDFKERTVKPVFTLTNGDEIGGFSSGASDFDGTPAKKVFITTRKIVSLINSNGTPVFTVPYTPGYSEYPQVQLNFLVAGKKTTNGLNNHFAVRFQPDLELNKKSGWKMPEHVRWIGPEGAVTKNLELPDLNPIRSERWPEKMATALLLPLLRHVAFVENFFTAGTLPMMSLAFDQEFLGGWNLLSYALGILCAVIGWTLARRCNFSTKASVGWAVFILLLGVAGLLTFLCVQEFPAREECPGCKKLRAVDRENCEHCDSEFSPPEKNGTEIFEPLV